MKAEFRFKRAKHNEKKCRGFILLHFLMLFLICGREEKM